MIKKALILLFILPILLLITISSMFAYSEQTQSFIINSFNIKSILNKKVKSFVSKKINDEKPIPNSGFVFYQSWFFQ